MLRQWIPAVLILTWAAVAAAQPAEPTPDKPAPATDKPAPAPADKPADKAPAAAAKDVVGKVTVVSVSGPAEKLIAPTDEKPQPKWEPIKAKDVLLDNTIIRTGFRAKVVLQFEDRATVTVNTATKMGVGQFRKVGDKTKVRLGLKYGSMHASIERAKGPHDVKVATPVATLSVRGSEGSLGFTGDMGLSFFSQAGTWGVQGPSFGRQVGPGEGTAGMGFLMAWLQMLFQQRDPRLGDLLGLNPDEMANLYANGSGRGVIGFTGSGWWSLRLFRLNRSELGSSGDNGDNGDNREENGYDEQ